MDQGMPKPGGGWLCGDAPAGRRTFVRAGYGSGFGHDSRPRDSAARYRGCTGRSSYFDYSGRTSGCSRAGGADRKKAPSGTT
jgi:hypothetical protein